MMENLTQYNDQELSLRVFNDESLYNIRHDDIIPILEGIFIFSDDQAQVLLNDLTDDWQELTDNEV